MILTFLINCGVPGESLGILPFFFYNSVGDCRRVRVRKKHQATSSWLGRVNWDAFVQCVKKCYANLLNVLHASLPSLSLFPVPSAGGKLGQWPFVLGHLPISACFGIYSPFVFVGKNPKVQHLWLSNMWLDVICTDVALKMHFPFLKRPPMHRQAPPEKTTTFLDVDLFWYGASAILNRTHRGAKTILLGPLWNSLERSWTPWT